MELLKGPGERTYFNGQDKPEDIETIKIVKGNYLQGIIGTEIIAVLKGAIGYNNETGGGLVIKEKQVVFIPPGIVFPISAEEDSHIILFRPTKQLAYIREYTGREEKSTWMPLDMKGQLPLYMECLSACLREGFRGKHFCTIKTDELFLFLKGYYSERELSHFFGPHPTSNTSFAYFIYNNYNKVRTVKELAVKANLSLSGFDKEFRKVFQTAPYRWMKQKRTESIYYEICHSIKPLKIISEEYGFSSTSQMNDYCKKEFGLPPGKIREYYKKNNAI